MRVTVDQLVVAVTELCQKSPDNYYSSEGTRKKLKSGKEVPACSYIQGKCSDKSCGCIVGQAFRNLGITTTQLKEIDDAGSIRQVFYSNNERGEYYRDVVFSSCDTSVDAEGKIEWLARLQNWQDHGYCWGDCLLHANELLKRDEAQVA